MVNEHLIRFAHPFGAVLKHVQPVVVSRLLTLQARRAADFDQILTAWE
jgi:hypothetical protein